MKAIVKGWVSGGGRLVSLISHSTPCLSGKEMCQPTTVSLSVSLSCGEEGGDSVAKRLLDEGKPPSEGRRRKEGTMTAWLREPMRNGLLRRKGRKGSIISSLFLILHLLILSRRHAAADMQCIMTEKSEERGALSLLSQEASVLLQGKYLCAYSMGMYSILLPWQIKSQGRGGRGK